MDPGREVGKRETRVSQGPKLGQGQGMYLSASCQSFGKLTETAGFVESAESVCDGIVLRGQMPYRVFPIAFRTPDEELSCQCSHSALGATADRQLKRCGVISQEGQAFEQLAVAAHGQNEPQQRTRRHTPHTTQPTGRARRSLVVNGLLKERFMRFGTSSYELERGKLRSGRGKLPEALPLGVVRDNTQVLGRCRRPLERCPLHGHPSFYQNESSAPGGCVKLNVAKMTVDGYWSKVDGMP